MKLLDVMKKYDRCVVRESAKLTKIYNLLLKESEEAEDIEEAEVCPDCGEDPCVCESGKEVDATEEVNEDDSNVMTAEEFFAEAEKAAEEANERGQSEEATNKVEEAEDDISAEEFFSEADNKEADVDEAEEMMSAEEFFSEAEAEAEAKEDADEQKEEVNETEEDIDEEDEEKKLEESLKSYRRANHRLFNN